MSIAIQVWFSDLAVTYTGALCLWKFIKLDSCCDMCTFQNEILYVPSPSAVPGIQQIHYYFHYYDTVKTISCATVVHNVDTGHLWIHQQEEGTLHWTLGLAL